MRILVTTGPTREYIDPVRFISNDASGRLGVELARAAQIRGHATCMIHGPINLAAYSPMIPPGVEMVPVVSTEEMSEAIRSRYPDIDVLFMVAAVADYKPVHVAPQKLKKHDKTEQVFKFLLTEDILKGLGAEKQHQFLVGFNLETERAEAEARRKLIEKNLDLIVLNGPENLGSLVATVTVLDRSGPVASWVELTKAEIAVRLLGLVEARLKTRTACDR
jgi:phosphopantothenoylcysteine decarboxylase/phosphopantothenate--cysteine ligase